ncbi:hypothetical protein F5I97DRAFT_1926849 [Phlebopus sp. FC_14]|nr:hypothetical protein F5I97DRAFT_1926849 [Phlebopus sp. FC_14]
MNAPDVNIYFRSTDNQNTWIHALQIPYSDIHRLCLRPLKWLRFVAFTISGAHGDLSETQDGHPVNYDNTSDLADTYYYIATEQFHLVDYNALNDRVTSSGLTPGRAGFRDNILNRDGPCVITRADSRICDAAHIIPRCKGDEYITFVVNDRRHLYHEQQFPPGMQELSINTVENGLLLRSDLHQCLGLGIIAFMKTPNFAMQCDDIYRVEPDPIPDTRITMQYMEPPTEHELYAPLPRDVHMSGTGESPPPSILLDLMYGAAVVKRWPTDALSQALKKRFEDFKNVTPLPDHSEGSSDESGNEYAPKHSRRKRGRSRRSATSNEMLQAMDHVLVLSMLLRGVTPEQIVAERERREKKAKAHTQEVTRVKVQQWQQAQDMAS